MEVSAGNNGEDLFAEPPAPFGHQILASIDVEPRLFIASCVDAGGADKMQLVERA